MWATYQSISTTLASGANSAPADILSGLKQLGVGYLGGTVLRTHVSLSLATGSADTQPGLYWGLIVYDLNKVAAGTPSAASEFYLDWAMLDFITPGTSMGNIARPETAPTSSVWGRTYDVKSRRRLHEPSDAFVFTLFNNSSGNLIYSAFIRSLVTLP